jgi:hypothetical protein
VLVTGKADDTCTGLIATDATAVYWTTLGPTNEQPMVLHSVPKAGGTESTLLSCAMFLSSEFAALAVDTTSIYWAANNPEQILRLAK